MILRASTSARQLTLVNPSSFDPAELGHERRYDDDCRYFMHCVLTKYARGDVDDEGFVRLRAELLGSVMTKEWCAPIIHSMIDRGFIERASYTVGVRSFGYRLAPQFAADKHIRWPIVRTRFACRLERAYKISEHKRTKFFRPVHCELSRRQQRLGIDVDLAHEILGRLPPSKNLFDSQAILVSDIAASNFQLTIADTGRVFVHGVSSLKRELRVALRIDKERLMGVDLRCAQPALLALLMQNHVRNQKNEEGEKNNKEGKETGRTLYDSGFRHVPGGDYEHFRDLACSGHLYDFLGVAMQRVGISMDRPQIKKKFMCDILAKRKANADGAEYPSSLEDVFAKHFPTVYAFIRQLNRNGWEHCNLIRRLQRAESELVIERVLTDLFAKYPTAVFIPLHDQIFATPKNVGHVQAAFHRAFKQLGFSMSMKIEGE